MPAASPAFWQERGAAGVSLLPLAALFRVLSTLRRSAFRRGVKVAVRLPVPVVVVGNIAVGGSGKTPVVDWLVGVLRQHGYRPGIVSRGYGGAEPGPCLVPVGGAAQQYGDEPLLLSRLTGCPVAIGRDRPAAGALLLQAHPDCDVIVSDDGMQHYRLARDVEIAVVDEAVLGNCWPLPAGPLREGLSRLREVDLVIAHGALSDGLRARIGHGHVFPMELVGERFRTLDDGGCSVSAAHFQGRKTHALAGIGRPERFFAQLEGMGLEVERHAFPDHHAFVPADLDFAPGEAKIMTSKDAVKCAPFATADCWEFPVQARIGSGAADRILEKLSNGRQTA
ncbi:tetraacyldisaccharide 4'-kinase [Azoarcus sp. TTM-91]|uniref:tetraacyldisaccharide 4'-kinase n=1 Tax=Azoarcus sp. TTM-91 TaxID=2691581 RepID=UPI00145F3FD3|nr:tetraacyldisaccharide 4'-kinase [Azoarcus sp. TTM-91]NMG34792.1 tetraacyldisaccharide 4'-kinase [Azoarcus sp. TTM-91]